jgi:hypothetical protein
MNSFAKTSRFDRPLLATLLWFAFGWRAQAARPIGDPLPHYGPRAPGARVSRISLRESW